MPSFKGKYIITASGCIDCHTPVTDKGDLIMEKAFGGGREFPMGIYGTIVSSNITFDKETGIGEMDKDMFIKMFKKYDLKTYMPPTLEKGDFNTPMAWTMYAKMDTADLAAIYYYLKSLPPIVNFIKSKPFPK